MRFGWFEIRDPRLRAVAYWLHALLPLAAAALYVWHRERGGRFRERRAWASFAAVAALAVVLAVVHALNPRPKSGVPHEGDRFFSPSLVRTQEGRLLPLRSLTMNEYCQSCHPDAYQGWLHSAHRFSSFNNPFYLASVKETRQVMQQRETTETVRHRDPARCRMPRQGRADALNFALHGAMLAGKLPRGLRVRERRQRLPPYF